MTRTKKRDPNPKEDPYLKKIAKGWPVILMAWDDFSKKKPIIELELPSMRVYAYAAKSYINSLTVRTRETARQQYNEAKAEGNIVVFVKDMKKEVLRSYTMPFTGNL